MKSVIPTPRVTKAESGGWLIEPFTISKEDAQMHNMRSLFHSWRYSDRSVSAGDYVRLLTANNQVMMSNTPAEMRDHCEFIRRASGNVLINGLGLGAVIEAILDPEHPWRRNCAPVTSITVIEKSSHVIRMVGPAYDKERRVNIIHADALTYTPPKGVRYNAVWHDIWVDICEDNLPQMHKLHRKYGRRTDWQGSWSRDIVERMRRSCY